METDLLKDKVVLVTGAGHTTGREIARAFAARGAALAVEDISPVNLDETVQIAAAYGGKVAGYTADVSKKMPVQRLITRTLEDFGKLDFLVNCANVEPQAPVLSMDEWDLLRTLQVNLAGVFLLTQIAGRVMKTLGGGTILHVVRCGQDARKSAAYAAKAGALAFVTRAAAELEKDNVRLRALSSGMCCRKNGETTPVPCTGTVKKYAGLPAAVLALCREDLAGDPVVCVRFSS